MHKIKSAFSQQANEGKYTLKCNNGIQNGIYCECSDGWVSSGIHQDDPMTFHWCDAELVDPSSFDYQPRKLSKVEEAFLVIVSLKIPMRRAIC